MSRIVKGTGWRLLSHVVETEDGDMYLVDSNDTFDVDYHNGYSEDKRVYRKETDFCSKGER